MKLATQLLAAYAVGSAVAEVYFKEQFNDDVSFWNDPDPRAPRSDLRMTWKLDLLSLDNGRMRRIRPTSPRKDAR